MEKAGNVRMRVSVMQSGDKCGRAQGLVDNFRTTARIVGRNEVECSGLLLSGELRAGDHRLSRGL